MLARRIDRAAAPRPSRTAKSKTSIDSRLAAVLKKDYLTVALPGQTENHCVLGKTIGPHVAVGDSLMNSKRRMLYLCAGLQCSGSTLVSWCFLQRHDMDGVLDGEYDLLPRIAPNLGRPLAWCKTTISSFRLSELVSHYEDEGWAVSPS